MIGMKSRKSCFSLQEEIDQTFKIKLEINMFVCAVGAKM